MDSVTRSITPALHVRNEQYWIHYVLRDLFSIFGRAVMIDTGSTDDTVGIAKHLARAMNADLTLIEENMGSDALRIGNCPNRLREMINTPWMLLVDGDEIWRERELDSLCAQVAILPAGTEVIMFNGRNLLAQNGQLMERDGFWADRLFGQEVRWHLRRDYPFQSHGLEERDARNAVFRASPGVFFWHVRHLSRSPKDEDAFFRTTKKHYFAVQEVMELDSDWLGVISPGGGNPYLDD